jgi:hypothetical protein
VESFFVVPQLAFVTETSEELLLVPESVNTDMPESGGLSSASNQIKRYNKVFAYPLVLYSSTCC